jgi:hypothetical protein
MSGNIVSVYQVSGQFEGEFVKSFLEAHGIQAGLAQESAGIVYGLTIGALGSVDVLVAESDVERARQLLNDFQEHKSTPHMAENVFH